MNKLDKSAQGSTTQHASSQANSDLDAIVIDLWDRVLERGPEARKASILDLKVGLLRAHRLLAAIANETGIAIPITALFKVDTAEKLTAALRSGAALLPEPLAEIKAARRGAPVFFFLALAALHWSWPS